MKTKALYFPTLKCLEFIEKNNFGRLPKTTNGNQFVVVPTRYYSILTKMMPTASTSSSAFDATFSRFRSVALAFHLCYSLKTVYKSHQDMSLRYTMNFAWKLYELLNTSLQVMGISSVSIVHFYHGFLITQLNVNMIRVQLHIHSHTYMENKSILP